MKRHETELLTIAQAEIDKEIIPVIQWLNSYQGVQTTYCCQGENEVKKENQHPYVLFSCLWDFNLVQILKYIVAFCGQFSPKLHCEVDYFTMKFPIRYRLKWESKIALLEFIEFLNKPYEEIVQIVAEREQQVQSSVYLPRKDLI